MVSNMRARTIFTTQMTNTMSITKFNQICIPYVGCFVRVQRCPSYLRSILENIDVDFEEEWTIGWNSNKMFPLNLRGRHYIVLLSMSWKSMSFSKLDASGIDPKRFKISTTKVIFVRSSSTTAGNISGAAQQPTLVGDGATGDTTQLLP